MVEMLAPVAPGQKVAAPSKEKPRTERGKSSPSNRNASQRRDPRLSSGPPAGTVRTGPKQARASERRAGQREREGRVGRRTCTPERLRKCPHWKEAREAQEPPTPH